MPAARHRDPIATRQRLLWAGFREMHRVGFRKADLDRVLEDARVTKGALYHHFGSKRGLAYAVIAEILRDWVLDRWLKPVRESSDPVDALEKLAIWGEKAATAEGLALGCPLAMLSQELSGIDEGFRLRLAAIYDDWRDQLAESLARAQGLGRVGLSVDTRAAATFIVAAWRGSIGLAKSQRSTETLSHCRQGLSAYLESLRPLGP